MYDNHGWILFIHTHPYQYTFATHTWGIIHDLYVRCFSFLTTVNLDLDLVISF